MTTATPVRPLGDLVDEHRRITQQTRTKGRRHHQQRARSLVLELHDRGQDLLAVLLERERHLVTAPVDVAGPDGRANLVARVTERASVQRRIRGLRAELGGAA